MGVAGEVKTKLQRDMDPKPLECDKFRNIVGKAILEMASTEHSPYICK